MWGSGDDGSTSWGVSHLSSAPITLTYGMLLLAVVVLLVVLRFAFADVSVRGGVR